MTTSQITAKLEALTTATVDPTLPRWTCHRNPGHSVPANMVDCDMPGCRR